MSNVFVNDFGTIFEITVTEDNTVVDLSSTTGVEIIFTHPSGQSIVKTASLKTTGIDGVVQYTTESGLFDAAGFWKVQARITFTYGQWRTSQYDFEVKP